MADFDHAIELNPNDDQAYADRALLHQSQSDLTGALDDISNAIRINPQVSQYYLMRGGLHALAENASSSAGDYLHWLVLNQTRYLKAPNTLTSSQAFTVQMAPGWVYVIPFKVTAGQTISVAASGTTPQDRVDPLLVILDIHGDPLVGDDDSGGNYNAAINSYVIPEDGEYTLILGGAGGGDQGDITVSLNLGN